jgi:hypothetical protein
MAAVPIVIHLSPERLEGVREQVEATLQNLAPVVADLAREHQAQTRRELVESFLGGAAPRPADMVRARLQARALRKIYEGTEWYTAAQLAELAGLGAGNPAATVNRWKQSRKVFAIERDGKDHFPTYAFGPDYRPLPALAPVLQVLAPWSGDRIAAWFESTSAFLQGQRPRELLHAEPQRVLEAAQRAVQLEQEGI